MDHKQEIKANFSTATTYYAENAVLQKKTAARLYNALKPWRLSIPEGPVLEIGAGTGFFTKHLLEIYGNRELIISDLSEEMIEHCRNELGDKESLNYRVLDAENEEWPESKYSLIAGNFVAQWFKDPGRVLSRISESLKPGGLMLISFPTKESYPDWRKYCLELGLPFTGNSLPDLEQVIINLSMGPVKVDYYEDDMFETFESVFDFFKHLKQSGTATNISGNHLSIKQLRLLNDYWLKQKGGKIEVCYHIAFIAVKRDLES